MHRRHYKDQPAWMGQNLIVHLPMREVEGGKSAVMSPHYREADVNGPVRWDGGAFFDGINDYLSIADSDDSKFTGDVTVLVWCYVSSGGVERQFCGKHAGGGATNCPFGFFATNAANPVMYSLRASALGYAFYLGPTCLVGQWAHYGLVLPAGDIVVAAPNFSVNGAVSSGTFGGNTGVGNPTGSGADIRIGLKADSFAKMHGAMRDMRIYDRVLAEHQIKQIMNFDRPGCN